MASKFFLSLAFAFLGFVSRASGVGDIACERLDVSTCAYAVSSLGLRCLLEKQVKRAGLQEVLVCQTSRIEAEGIKNYIESDACIEACQLNRYAVGISTDSLLDAKFIRKLCSTKCYNSCPNIADLYFNLAAGEGVYLPNLCENEEKVARRELVVTSPAEFQAASSPAEPPM
ncbi:uncharacterized protein [Typha angustifolia]|uniref:uncharacterized protein n=1 Tax=Typha angustifolia TaxID=59011 RepID=UPI003C2F6EA2